MTVTPLLCHKTTSANAEGVEDDGVSLAPHPSLAAPGTGQGAGIKRATPPWWNVEGHPGPQHAPEREESEEGQSTEREEAAVLWLFQYGKGQGQEQGECSDGLCSEVSWSLNSSSDTGGHSVAGGKPALCQLCHPCPQGPALTFNGNSPDALSGTQDHARGRGKHF